MISEKKTALVTGGNKGIGFETARQLAQLGYVVWIGCRDAGRGEAAAAELRKQDGDVRFLALDVADDESVRKAVTALSAETTRLDVLVNNAAIAIAAEDRVPSTIDLATVRATYEVNLYGPLRVTQGFMPLLRAAAAARIVMVSSGLGSLTKQADPTSGLSRWPVFAYSSSKSALNALTIALANELRKTPIKVNAVDPGFNATDLNGHTGTQPPSQGARVVVRVATLDASGPSGTFIEESGPEPW